MPSAKNVTVFVQSAPNAFVSPFSDRPPLALYSSIPVLGRDSGQCISCASVGLTRAEYEKLILEIANKETTLPRQEIVLSQDLPVIPPYPDAVNTLVVRDFDAEFDAGVRLAAVSYIRIEATTIVPVT